MEGHLVVARLALFYFKLVIKPVRKLSGEASQGGPINKDGDPNIDAVFFVGDRNLVFLEKVQELIMQGVADGDVNGSLDDPLDKAGLVDSVSGDIAVCADQAARPELDAAKVAGNDGHDIVELSKLEGF